jgi:sugar/nucleoside kinase (ribokinase family)
LRELLPYTDWFLPNDTEAVLFTGEREPFRAMERLREWGAANLVVTRGESGALAASGKKIWQCGAYQWPTVDPSGAGDAFASGIITGIVHGWELPQTLRYASAIGASATRAVGTTTSVFTFAEALDAVKREPVPVTVIAP